MRTRLPLRSIILTGLGATSASSGSIRGTGTPTTGPTRRAHGGHFRGRRSARWTYDGGHFPHRCGGYNISVANLPKARAAWKRIGRAIITQATMPSAALRATPRRAEGVPSAAPSARRISFWVSWLESVENSSNLLETLQEEGGLGVASTLIVYCGDKITANGTFEASLDDPKCDALAAGARAMGLGFERVVGGDMGGVRLLFNASAAGTAAVGAMASLVQEKKLTGLSWDIEPDGTTWRDALAFGQLNRALQAAIHPLGARITTYSNNYSKIIADIDDYQGGVDMVMAGQTYNGKSYNEWLANYEYTALCFQAGMSCGKNGSSGGGSAVAGARAAAMATSMPAKYAPSMLADVERGDWNCEVDGMKRRVERLLKDGVAEMGLFVLTAKNLSRTGSCIREWFPYARAFIAGNMSGVP